MVDGRLSFQFPERKMGLVSDLSLYADGYHRPVVYSSRLQSAEPDVQSGAGITPAEDSENIQGDTLF